MDIKRKNMIQMFYTCVAFILLVINQVAYAVVIGPNTVISSPTTFSNTTVDLSNGSFIITNNATLTIENSSIIGTLSSSNPILFNIATGKLVLTNNTAQITASGITPHPETQSLFYVIQLAQGTTDLTGNKFSIDKQFSAGFLITTINLPTKNIHVANNMFQNFHGVLYLLNTAGANIDGNYFKLNSYGNLVLVGNNATINNNRFAFSGVSELGNGMDILDSDTVTITNNVLFTPTCHGIYILRGQNIVVDSNNVTGGKTYGINVLASVLVTGKNDYALKIVNKAGRKVLKHASSSNITISNNLLGQNRYGLAATDVNVLMVTDNFFSQRFDDADARKFWTDNAVLLQNVTGLTWTNNIYKEAFTQVNGGDNSNTEFVVFPATGGVVL